MVDDDYISAEEAAALLGVTIDTFYVYVTRKNLRSTGIPNSRKRRYWRADVEQLRGRGRKPPASPTDLDGESSITLLTEDNLFYRGQSVRELVNRPTFESVAALLWDVDADAVFGESLPAFPDTVKAVSHALVGESPMDQAIALFPLIERANPRSQDFSPAGMARTGGDVLRAFTALIAGHDRPDRRALHVSIAEAFGLTDRQAALLRRVMILAADHGLEPATFAVRAIASTGVSPWRAVSTGLTSPSPSAARRGRSSSPPSAGWSRKSLKRNGLSSPSPAVSRKATPSPASCPPPAAATYVPPSCWTCWKPTMRATPTSSA
ncbi:citrate synthase [Nitrospirillum viridazoti]|uniref:Helix-turn-helix domain-containing protein n=1 Tax=Nitrospirillum viridazoti CBAmc TaxID=1441467 RepID=A0A248K4B5_9PROT|nr:citrate synthase [Nitrospirillum amazonense]ASG25304.1 hypothetical protein Y958_30670 [Nitrospirillum amazonense CBAmc]